MSVAYRALEKLINLHDGYRRVFRLANREMLLLQENDEPRLLERRCPHAGQLLDLAPIDTSRLVCPRHGVSFSLADGSPEPPICPALHIRELVYEGNSVGVEDCDE